MEPERAHGLAIKALQTGLLPAPGPVSAPRLAVELAGMALPNPVGLAAGFDKNAEAVGPLSRAGFGFVEVGAATPVAQPGNAKPRLFRLTEDRAAINRFGFKQRGDGGDRGAACGGEARGARWPEPRGEQGEPRPRGAISRACWRAAARMWISRRSTSPRPTPNACASCRGARRWRDCLQV